MQLYLRSSSPISLPSNSLPRPILLYPLFPHWALFSPMSGTTQRDPTCVKALEAFLSPRAPTSFTEARYTRVPTEDLQPLATWAQQLASPPDVIHINVVDATLLGKGWMYRVNDKLRSVHPSLRAIGFRFPVEDMYDLCQQATGKLDTSPRQFDLEIVDTSDM